MCLCLVCRCGYAPETQVWGCSQRRVSVTPPDNDAPVKRPRDMEKNVQKSSMKKGRPKISNRSIEENGKQQEALNVMV
ncbi:hypothetical protein E2C01_035768 [Portunus trituberculatus]|uniref:Uncharacterized protein n=1 Tax=Portunus trituberculatus TaxID=210409 RepID=A0A5B7FCC8_PORTR|nr:hypothetical protein [Portunus trituberculatus]